MSLLSVIVAIVIVGIVLWIINQFIPMEARVKQILNIVVILILLIWVLQGFGFFGYLRGIKI
jgi:predicted membrane protein